MSKQISAKIDELKLKNILMKERINPSILAKKAGIHKAWVSRISSKSMKYKCSVVVVNKILEALDNKYEFEDIFFWV